jgi:hypothetical protein
MDIIDTFSRISYNSGAMTPDLQPKGGRRRYWANLTLAGIAGQVGCLTLVIIAGALLLGLWLDAQLNSRPLVTLILLVASVPVSLGTMFFVVRQAVKRIKSDVPAQKSDHSEEAGHGN